MIDDYKASNGNTKFELFLFLLMPKLKYPKIHMKGSYLVDEQ